MVAATTAVIRVVGVIPLSSRAGEWWPVLSCDGNGGHGTAAAAADRETNDVVGRWRVFTVAAKTVSLLDASVEE